MDVKLINGKWCVNGKSFSEMLEYEKIILDIFIKKRWLWN